MGVCIPRTTNEAHLAVAAPLPPLRGLCSRPRCVSRQECTPPRQHAWVERSVEASDGGGGVAEVFPHFPDGDGEIICAVCLSVRLWRPRRQPPRLLLLLLLRLRVAVLHVRLPDDNKQSATSSLHLDFRRGTNEHAVEPWKVSLPSPSLFRKLPLSTFLARSLFVSAEFADGMN